MLCIEGDSLLTLTEPHRHVSIHPIRGCRLATLFLHRTDAPIAGEPAARLIERLAAVYETMGWVIPDLIDRLREMPSFYFDDVVQVEMPTWSRGRTVLLGDACWCSSLFAGQGVSLAMVGAYLLARELTAHCGDLAFALTSYEQRLKPAIAKKQRAGRRMAKWFVPESPWRLAVRDFGARVSTWPLARPWVRSWLAAEKVL